MRLTSWIQFKVLTQARLCFSFRARARARAHTHTHLHRPAHRRRYLVAAEKCARFADGSVDSGRWPMFGHKLAWGAAELYKVNQDPAVGR